MTTTPRILLSCYPRCGSSLFLSHVLSRFPKAGFDPVRTPDSFSRGWANVAELPSHDEASFIISKRHEPPETAAELDAYCGAVMMVRDPRPALYSHWKFVRSAKYGWGPQLDFADWLSWYQPTWKNWHRHYGELLRSHFGERFYWMRFENVSNPYWSEAMTEVVTEVTGELPTGDVRTFEQLQQADSTNYSGEGSRWLYDLPARERDLLTQHCVGAWAEGTAPLGHSYVRQSNL